MATKTTPYDNSRWWWRHGVCRIDWRWGSYLTAVFFSFLILAAGAIAQKSGDSITPMDLVRAGLYVGWIAAMGLFVGFNYNGTPTFFMRALFHLACTALTLLFICSVGQITSDHLHIWIPFSTTCGIFIAFSFAKCGSCFCEVIKKTILNLLGASPPPHSLLPMHRLDTHAD
ncbi:hypothetical protein V8F06_012664 [Rhypophila decipiens]